MGSLAKGVAKSHSGEFTKRRPLLIIGRACDFPQNKGRINMMKDALAPRNLLNWLLVFVPVAIALELWHASALAVFIASALAIVPLAGWMGRATEHLAERLGEGIGGLLNATFCNAAELIISVI